MGVLGVLLLYLHLLGVWADSLLSVLDALTQVMEGGGIYSRKVIFFKHQLFTF